MSEQYELWLFPLADETRPAVRYLVNKEPVIFDSRDAADRAAKNMNRISIHRYFSKSVDADAKTEGARVVYSAPVRRKKAQKAIEQVATNTESDWRDTARDALKRVALAHEHFSSQDVWQALGDASPHTPSAMGPIFVWAKKQGWIERDGYVTNARTTSHRSELPRWRSILYAAQKGYHNV